MDKIRNHIKFVEDTHQYFNVNTNEEYLSITKFVSNYYPKFEADDIALNLVTTNSKYIKKYEGLPIEEAVARLKEEWAKRTQIGNEVHNTLEKYVTEGLRDDKYSDIFDNLRLKERYPDFQIVPEMLLYSDKYKMAGQSDLVLINEKEETFIIFDYKTNEKGIQKRSYNDKRMFSPLDHLPDCNYYHYSLQLTLYAYLLREETGYKCDGLTILWVDTAELIIRQYSVGNHWGDISQILADSLRSE